jgi:hypothetical protein
MVSFEENGFLLPSTLPINKIRNDSLGVGPSIYIVTQEHDTIHGVKRQSLEKACQLLKATVDVSDHIALHDFIIVSYYCDPCKSRLRPVS